MSTSSRLLLLCAAAVTAALTATAAAQATVVALKSPRLDQIARGPAAIRDTVLPKRSLRSLLPSNSYWGGPFTAKTGESVNVYVSGSYPEDPATGQRWADFLAGLVHGPELSAVTLYLAPASEVESICGAQALACYGAQQDLLVAPGDDPSSDTSAEAVVTHEYGHHIAAHRSNAPWPAIDWGTKRWASYEQVCANASSGRLYPGAETPPRYTLNPGEGFAETYRVLNERKAGLAELPWDVVSQALYPDDTALALLEQDVTTPWQASTTTSRTGTVTKAARSRTYTVPTPLDGTLRLTLRAAAGERLSLDAYAPSSTRVGHALGSRTLSLTTTICGQRSARIRVGRISGAGTFRLAIATP